MSDEREIIIELEERFAATTNASDVREFEYLFTADAMLMMPDRPVVSGREAIVSHHREISG
jgi:ketosteroid isomerase-like protein